MCSEKSTYSFNIELPENTPSTVVDWFKFHKSCNTLTNELVSLVEAHIKHISNSESQTNNMDAFDTVTCIKQTNSSEVELLETLYNWKDSVDDIFKQS